MPDLRPTATRVALLQAVADGMVTERYDVGNGWYAVWDRGPGAPWPPGRIRRVTAAMNDLYRAGWVALPVRDAHPRDTSPRPFEITDAGWAVLEEAARP